MPFCDTSSSVESLLNDLLELRLKDCCKICKVSSGLSHFRLLFWGNPATFQVSSVLALRLRIVCQVGCWTPETFSVNAASETSYFSSIRFETEEICDLFFNFLFISELLEDAN
jgi:hypothetical protein